MRSRVHAHDGAAVLVVAVAITAATATQANVTISLQPTQNMTCTNGVCAPTQADAILNRTDLHQMLDSGDVTVTTTGSGVEATDIEVTGSIGWNSPNMLALDAYRSITVEARVRVEGFGGVMLTSNRGGGGGSLTFAENGNLTIAQMSDVLDIDGKTYRLEYNIQQLAYDIVARPTGSYALANDYDASRDGLYRASPIPVPFSGAFNGLGHVISKLEIADEAQSGTGFFGTIAKNGTVTSIGFAKEVVTGYSIVGGVAGFSYGVIGNSFVNGTIDDFNQSGGAGGLVGDNYGLISNCRSAAAVLGAYAGGLVAENIGAVETSFATGGVTGLVFAGGLAGANASDPHKAVGTITNSYATGDVFQRKKSKLGGFVGDNSASISAGYSSGAVSGNVGSKPGGFAGNSTGTLDNSYWDTTTSGITNLAQGCGNISNCPGVTGLTTAQFQSGLPAGFDPNIWGENPNVNGGLPYLLANPPPK